MIYHFDSEVAKKYGVNGAIMIANFQYWIIKNKANDKNFFDGHYWTYNSKKALMELFPFWSEQNIKTILNHLKEKGVLITGNYNNSAYDRTLWYAFADEEQWIGEKQLFQKLELTNEKVKTNQTIPNINTNINTNNVYNKPTKNKNFIPPTIDECKEYAKELHCKKELGIDFFNYYNLSNWIDGKGKQILRWKQKMYQWYMHDKEKYYNDIPDKPDCPSIEEYLAAQNR